MGFTLNVQRRRALPLWIKMIGGQGTFSIPSFRLCCAARNFRGCLSRALASHKTAFGSRETALLYHKALSCPRNPHCYTAKHFSAPEICIVTQQSTFLPQESALLRHKALFACPLELSCLGRVSRILPTSNQKPRPQTFGEPRMEAGLSLCGATSLIRTARKPRRLGSRAS